MEKKTISFGSMVSDYMVINPEFARVKVYVCYAGKNRNRSEIPKDVLDEMAQSIYGIPVVAEYDKDNNCFKGHGGKLEVSDDGIEFKQTTMPYGFVDPKTPIFYEKVTELDGITENEYLCCYAYLWYKRYPEIESVLRNQDNKKIGQSMEIELEDYDWTDDDYCLVKKGHFSALAMLGVEPCFESAMVTSKFSKEEIKGEYQDMIKAFKQYTIEAFEEGGDVVEDNKELEYNEEVKSEEIQEEILEMQEEVVEELAEIEEEKEDFETKYNEVVAELNEVKAQYTDIQGELETLKGEYSAIETEVTELREYKSNIEFEAHKVEVDEKLATYSELETIEGYADLVKDKYACDVEALEKEIKIFAFDNGIVIGKKQVKKNFSKNETVRIPITNNIDKSIKVNDIWDNVLGKYIKK